MHKYFEQFLKRHGRLDAIQHCIRHSKNEDYCQKAAEKNPMVLTCRKYGPLNIDKNIYLIEFGDKTDGFFAEYRKVLNFLYYADYFHMVPVVKWTDDFLYSEKVEVNGSKNPFEYYFEQPDNVTINEVYKSRNVFRCERSHLMLAESLKTDYDGYDLSESYLNAMSRIMAKYIRLKSTVKEKILGDINKLFSSKRTLGIHVRGTDFRNNYYGHPVFTNGKKHLQVADEQLDKGNFEQVFLATDDLLILDEFKKRLGNNVVFYKDVKRGEGQVSVAFEKNERELHHYKLGLEVLRDMWTLSTCEGLVAGRSQVSICAQIAKKSREEKYAFLSIIDEGTNKRGKYFK